MTDTPMTWRKSTYSDGGGSCVELARAGDGGVLIRNSNHPDAGTLAFSTAAMAAWIAGCAAGGLDDLTG
jgi:hypothetical protein